MGFTFDGDNKRIILTAGTTVLDIQDCYSRWKEWVQLTDNSKYLEAFAPVGGDPIDIGAGIFITSYYFLQNGWKVRPQEANHKLVVTTGVLLTDDGSDPFVPTLGAFNVLVQYSQPIKTETVATGAGPSPGDISTQVWNDLPTNLAALPGNVWSSGEGANVVARLLEMFRLVGLDASVSVEHGETYIRCPADGSILNVQLSKIGNKAIVQRL